MSPAHPPADFRLLVITPPAPDPAEPAVATRLLAAGLPRLHLRKPAATAAELATYLDALPAWAHPRIVLHSHYALAAHYPLAGLHLTTAARAAWPRLRRHWHPGLTLSTGIHSLPELLRLRRRYDYVLLSPLFDSLSKPGYSSAYHLADCAAALAHLRRRPSAPAVLGLGGITAAKLPLLRQAGFDGAALLGHIWQAPDPVAAWQQVVAALAPV